jgi:hypothetical protein
VANNNYGSSVRTATYTVPEPKPTRLEVSVNKSYTANVDKMTGFVPSVTIGGVAVPSNGEFTVPQVTKTVTGSGYTTKPEDTQLTFNFRVCLDMTLVAPGDDVELSTVATGGAQAVQGGYTGWVANTGSIQSISPQTDNQRTIPDPEPTSITVELNRSFVSLTSGTTYAFSADIKKGSTSVTLASCPNQGPDEPPVSLFSLGGASVSGKFAVGSKITATPNRWSRTNGGAAVTTTNSYDWLVCSSPQATSTTSPNAVPCIQGNNLQFVLANGTSIGQGGAPGSWYAQSSLTITQPLLTALTGKYLLVVVSGTASTPTALGNVFMQTCGPITTNLSCSVTFGTPAVVKKNQTFKALPKTAKAGKSVAISALTGSKVAVKVTVSGKGCKVAAVKDKKKKVVSHKLTMGKKNVTCTVTVTAPGSSTLNTLKYVAKIKAT